MATYQRFATDTRMQLVEGTGKIKTLVPAPDSTEFHKRLFRHCTGGDAPITMAEFHQEVEGMFWAHGITLIEIREA